MIRTFAMELFSAVLGVSEWQQVPAALLRALQACRLQRRTKHPSTPQLLLEGLDWPLT